MSKNKIRPKVAKMKKNGWHRYESGLNFRQTMEQERLSKPRKPKTYKYGSNPPPQGIHHYLNIDFTDIHDVQYKATLNNDGKFSGFVRA